MESTQQKIRNRKFISQGGRCFYCKQPMWLGSPDAFSQTHSIKKGKAHLFQCTAEHLDAVCDGGKVTFRNIVAACRFCNQTRHRARSPLNPEDFLAHVHSRLAKGRWFRLREN